MLSYDLKGLLGKKYKSFRSCDTMDGIWRLPLVISSPVFDLIVATLELTLVSIVNIFNLCADFRNSSQID